MQPVAPLSSRAYGAQPRPSLRAQLTAPGPTPHWSIADPATWVAVASVVSSILFGGFGITDPTGNVRLGILIGTAVVLGAIAFAKHLLSFQSLLADLISVFEGWTPPAKPLQASYVAWTGIPSTGRAQGGIVASPHRRAGRRGRLPVKAPAQRFPIRYLHEYMATALPAPTYPIDVSGRISAWGMLGNGPDAALTVNGGRPVSNCVFAGRQHYKMAKAAAVKTLTTEIWETSDELVTEYLTFDQGQDVGANIADALLAWYKAGKILAFAPVDLSDRTKADAAMLAFRGLLCGVALTDDADQLFEDHRVWTVAGGQQSNPQEGHCIIQTGATGPTSGDLDTFVTWGALQRAQTGWTAACRDEAWVIITSEDQVDPAALAAMRADIDALGGTQAAAG